MEDRLFRIFQFKEQMFAPLAGILMAPPRFLIMRSEVMIFARLVGILMGARRFLGTSWASTHHKAHH